MQEGSSEIVFDRDMFLSNGSKHEIAFRNSVLQLQHFAQVSILFSYWFDLEELLSLSG